MLLLTLAKAKLPTEEINLLPYLLLMPLLSPAMHMLRKNHRKIGPT